MYSHRCVHEICLKRIPQAGPFGKLADERWIKQLQALTTNLETWNPPILTHLLCIRVNSLRPGYVENKIETSKHGQVYFSPYKKGVVIGGTDIEFPPVVFTSSTNFKAVHKNFTTILYATGKYRRIAMEATPKRMLLNGYSHEKGLLIVHVPHRNHDYLVTMNRRTDLGQKGKALSRRKCGELYITPKY